MYADVLFLLNAAMDTLLLWLTRQICGYRLTGIRCLLGAGVGAASGVTITLAGVPAAGQAALAVPVSLLMVFCAFGRCGGAGGFFRTAGILWSAAMLTGGTVLLLAARVAGNSVRAGLLLALAAGSGGAIMFWRVLRRVRNRRFAGVTVQLNGRTAAFRALCDSGCLAADPLTGRPVMIVSSAAGSGLCTAEDLAVLCGDDPEALLRLSSPLRERARLLLLENTSGRSLIIGIPADSVRLETGRHPPELAAVLVFRCGTAASFGGAAGILPASALPV